MTGKCLSTYSGHQGEVVAISFDPNGLMVATGSMDCSAKLWDVEMGKIHSTLKGHEG